MVLGLGIVAALAFSDVFVPATAEDDAAAKPCNSCDAKKKDLGRLREALTAPKSE